MKQLKQHDALLKINAARLSDKDLSDNEDNMYKVKWIADYAKDVEKQVNKRLKIASKELAEMRDDAAKQKQKQRKK